MQGGTISSAIYALALAARSMSRPSPTTGSLTRGNGRGVTDFWPAASGAAPEAQYIPKRGGFWGVRHCRGQRTHRPRQSPVRMRGWGGVWLGRQVCHWARKSSPLKNADENCSLGKKSKAAEVRLKSYLHDLHKRMTTRLWHTLDLWRHRGGPDDEVVPTACAGRPHLHAQTCARAARTR